MPNLPDADQPELPIIHREIEKASVDQRATDGYINASKMCRIAGKKVNNYTRMDSTKAYLEELSSVTRIRVTELLQQAQGGKPELQGTWVHPQVAIHLAQWLSPKFAVMVSKWVFDWISGQSASKARLPDHIRRYMINRPKIPNTHFSMLDQMTLRLLAPLESKGYLLPSHLMPDISLGKMFSKWLQDKGYDPNTFPAYEHEFLDYRPTVQARLYPNELMSDFNIEMENWLRDGRSWKYFSERDVDSIEPLKKSDPVITSFFAG